MIYSWCFVIFYRKTSQRGFWVVSWVLGTTSSKLFSDFLEIPWFPKILSLSCSATMKQLVHSLSGVNNLIPFHLWWREIVLKREKLYKCFFSKIVDQKLKNTTETIFEVMKYCYCVWTLANQRENCFAIKSLD